MIKIDIGDIFKLQTEGEIEEIYLKLNKDLYKYNSRIFSFFGRKFDKIFT